MVETWTEFCQRHGGNPVRLKDDALCFADGATGVECPGGHQCHEPPDDPRALLTLIRDYHRKVLGYLAAQFTAVQNAARGGTPYLNWDDRLGPRPQGLDAPALLEHLQEKARQPAEKLKAIEAQIAALPGNIELAEREARLRKAMAKRESAALAQLRKVESMTLTPANP